ncbi:matrix-remodeling-associated protein 7 isoform X2 [Sorex fumeus]|uniref:matrix-remodeling-associated protein 7 isoform X2 n=1 Tax=Sorex fumeus TaxID=62283 RepID=UPI0024AD2F64|nr:matrix-remodeling-associated protein 7 isoform X2 [Sorex fumeus]
MEAPAELLAALPALATALALLIAWLLVRRGAAQKSAPGGPGKANGRRPAEQEDTEPRKEEKRQLDRKPDMAQAESEEDTGGESVSFHYSPGKLRGNQYKKMLAQEELEAEQRIELTSDLTSL